GQKLNTIGLEQTDRIGGLLGQPVSMGNEATESRLMDLGRKRLDPMFEQRRASLDSQLVNRGIRPGTEAYNREMTRFDQGQNDAYHQLLLSGRGQAVQESLAERNQPINEISALMSGGQVSQPNFVGTPQPGVAGVDYAGLVNQNYQSQVANHQNKLGGLFGL